MKKNLNNKVIIISALLSSILMVFILVPYFTYAIEDVKYISIDNVEVLKKTKNLSVGSLVKTKGYYNSGDGGAALYKITKAGSTGDNPGVIALTSDPSLVAVLQFDKNNYINVKQLGVKSGITSQTKKNDADISVRNQNTKIINSILSNYPSTITLFFPPGRYLLNNLSVTKNSNVTIEGISNGFASVFNYKQGDVYSVLIFDSENNSPVVKLNSNGTNITINNISIYGGFYKCKNGLRRKTSSTNDCSNDVKPIFGNTKSVFISGNNKGKLIKTRNVSFVQWGTVIGNEYESNTNKKTLAKSGVNNIKVDIERTRFTLNSIAISNVVDSKITYSSLNSNDYPFVFDGGYGNTTISHCRVEWSKANSYFIRGTKEGAPSNITIDNNELDRAVWAIIYITYNTNKPKGIKLLNSVMVRAGAGLLNEREKSVHLWVNGCKDCQFKGNFTKKKCNNDTSCSGEGKGKTPKYVSNFQNCEDTVVEYNDLTGGTASSNLNIVKNSGSLTQSNLSKKNFIK